MVVPAAIVVWMVFSFERLSSQPRAVSLFARPSVRASILPASRKHFTPTVPRDPRGAAKAAPLRASWWSSDLGSLRTRFSDVLFCWLSADAEYLASRDAPSAPDAHALNRARKEHSANRVRVNLNLHRYLFDAECQRLG
jgi:hypothetical protein